MTRQLRLGGLLGICLLASVALWYGHRGDFSPGTLRAQLAGNEWAPALFVLVHIIASLISIPRTALAVAAGLIFGLWWGIALATVGAMSGAFIGFALVRYLHAGLVRVDREKWLGLMMAKLEQGGWRAVMAIRLMPLPATLVNFAFGLTSVSLRAYLSGTFLGLLPLTVVCVDVGAAGNEALNGSNSWLEPALVGAAALIVSLILPRLRL